MFLLTSMPMAEGCSEKISIISSFRNGAENSIWYRMTPRRTVGMTGRKKNKIFAWFLASFAWLITCFLRHLSCSCEVPAAQEGVGVVALLTDAGPDTVVCPPTHSIQSAKSSQVTRDWCRPIVPYIYQEVTLEKNQGFTFYANYR